MRVVFDIGGTNMRVATVTVEGIGEIQKISTPQEPQEGITTLATLIRDCAEGGAIEAVAGGFPGVVSEGTIHYGPNLPKWKGVAFATELSRALEASVQVENDADLAALGEASHGAGSGFRTVVYVGIGTGIGCGRVVEGRIDRGMYDFEAGHQIIDVKAGAELESLVSGRAFEKRFGVHPKEAPRAGYDEMTPVLAAGLYNMMLHWSPDIFVLGGSMMNEDNGYRLLEIIAALERLPRVYPRLPEVRLPKFRDTAALHGARAMLDAI